jgi:hypothetical protein
VLGRESQLLPAVCPDSGAVEAIGLLGNRTAHTSLSFLQQLRAAHAGPLIVIWDNGPAPGGEVLRSYLATPDLCICAWYACRPTARTSTSTRPFGGGYARR